MKLSTKEISQKIKAREEILQAQEKLALEQKKAKKAESMRRAKTLAEISDKALDTALKGLNEFQLDITLENKLHEVEPELDERFIYSEERDAEENARIQLEFFFETCGKKKEFQVAKQLVTSAWKLRDICVQILDDGSDIIDLLDQALNYENPIIDRFTAANQACIELLDLFDDEENEYYKLIIEKEIAILFDQFNITYLFQKYYEYQTVTFLYWDELKDDDTLRYEQTDDYFNFLGLGWLANTHGQLFVSALENLIDKKIELNKNSLKMHLYKFSSGYRLQFENKAEMYTVLDEDGFSRLFKKLGYKTTTKETEIDEVDIEISW